MQSWEERKGMGDCQLECHPLQRLHRKGCRRRYVVLSECSLACNTWDYFSHQCVCFSITGAWKQMSYQRAARETGLTSTKLNAV